MTYSLKIKKPINHFAIIFMIFLVINYIYLIAILIWTHFKCIVRLRNKQTTEIEAEKLKKSYKNILNLFEGFRPGFKYTAFFIIFSIIRDTLIPAVLIFGVINSLIQMIPILVFWILMIIALICF